MRDINFRGKRKRDGKWVYGYYVRLANSNKYAIKNGGQLYIVVPETVGQYIGCEDEEDHEIYEGNILMHMVKSHGINYVYQVYYDEEYAGFMLKMLTKDDLHPNAEKIRSIGYSEDFRIVGNAVDNPELIKE